MMKSVQQFVDTATEHDILLGGIGTLDKEAGTDDPAFNKLWHDAQLAAEKVCDYLLENNIVPQLDSELGDDLEDDDGFDFDDDEEVFGHDEDPSLSPAEAEDAA